MSYATLDTAGRDTTFQATVRQAVVAQAQVVAAEDPATDNHTARVLYAMQVARSVSSVDWPSWTWSVLADGLTNSSSTDAVVLARVAALWNQFAGVS